MELFKFFLPFGVALLVWAFISQGIAWLLVDKTSDDTTEQVHILWAGVFLMPFLIGCFILPAMLEHRLRKEASKSGLVPSPSDNPMDYIL